MKHQSGNYRNIGGKHYTNYCDLIMDEKTNAEVVAEAKEKFISIRKIKHPAGFIQLFVSNRKDCPENFKRSI